jgi:excisionase family DNA binding protein
LFALTRARRPDVLGQIGEIIMVLSRLAYSISEACALTSVGRTTLYAAIKSGDLKTHKVGRRTLITAKELVAWLDSHLAVQVGAPTAAGRVAANVSNNGRSS